MLGAASLCGSDVVELDSQKSIVMRDDNCGGC